MLYLTHQRSMHYLTYKVIFKKITIFDPYIIDDATTLNLWQCVHAQKVQDLQTGDLALWFTFSDYEIINLKYEM